MGFDYQRLRLGERVAGACAVLLLIVMFLPWYSVGPFNGSAWDFYAYTDLLLFLLILVTLGLVILTATQRAPALPIAGSVIVTLFAGLMTLIVLYRIVNQPGPNSLVGVEIGAYIGLLLTAAIAAGGFLSMRDEGTSLGAARVQAEARMAERRTAGGGATTTSGSTSSPPAGTAAPAAGASPPGSAPEPAAAPTPGEPPPAAEPTNP